MIGLVVLLQLVTFVIQILREFSLILFVVFFIGGVVGVLVHDVAQKAQAEQESHLS